MMCSFTWNRQLLPLIVIVLKIINLTLWRFGDNLLRIDLNIDENVQFSSQHRVVNTCCDRLKKLNLLCEGLKTIH